MLTLGRRMLLEWLLLTALLVGLAVVGTLHALRVDQPWSSLHRGDALIHDTLLPLAAIEPSPSLVLIEIDQASLDSFGRWPWPRTVLAAMIDRLAASGVSAIGLDVLFIEPTDVDEPLARAIRAAQQAGVRVVLPISIAQNSLGLWYPLYPVADIAGASELGHVHFRIDGDGLVRGLYLQEGGFPAFSLRLMPNRPAAGVQPVTRQALTEASPIARDRAVAKAQWPLGQYSLLSRLKRPVERISFANIFRANQTGSLKNKTVLIGATAAGLGDQYANGLIGVSALSAGVELHAAAYSAIEQSRLIQPLDPFLACALASVLVLLAMIMLYRSTARTGLLLTMVILAISVAIAAAWLRVGYWWPPSAALLLIATAYPLWSWRRLEAATTGLVKQAEALGAEPLLSAGNPAQPLPAEQVSRSLQQLQYAAQRSVELRRLLQSTLQNLPHPAVLTDQDNRPVLSNERFDVAFAGPLRAAIDRVQSLPDWIEQNAGLKLAVSQDGSAAQALEQRDNLGRDWLIDAVPMRYPDGRWWTLIQMVDLSPIRAAQREREQTLRFLSHDLRSPLLSILTLVRDHQSSAEAPAWLDRVDTFAQRSLELADGFVHLARAENQAIAHETIDLADLMIEASDQCWALARDRSIRLDSKQLPQDALVKGDAQLIRRALVNLIDNAIKFSPTGARVRLGLAFEPAAAGPLKCDSWCATVSDEGQGLPADELSRVFEPFWRSASHENRPGAGLGLAFVRVVAERHAGLARAGTEPNGGARFELRFPSTSAGP